MSFHIPKTKFLFSWMYKDKSIQKPIQWDFYYVIPPFDNIICNTTQPQAE